MLRLKEAGTAEGPELYRHPSTARVAVPLSRWPQIGRLFFHHASIFLPAGRMNALYVGTLLHGGAYGHYQLDQPRIES